MGYLSCIYYSLVVMVSFDSDEYSYNETDGSADDIMISINTQIAQDLTVTINGG